MCDNIECSSYQLWRRRMLSPMQVLPERIVVYVDASTKDNAMCTVAFRVSERLCACARIHAICQIMPSGRRAKPQQVCALRAGFTQCPSHLRSEHRGIQA